MGGRRVRVRGLLPRRDPPTAPPPPEGPRSSHSGPSSPIPECAPPLLRGSKGERKQRVRRVTSPPPSTPYRLRRPGVSCRGPPQAQGRLPPTRPLALRLRVGPSYVDGDLRVRPLLACAGVGGGTCAAPPPHPPPPSSRSPSPRHCRGRRRSPELQPPSDSPPPPPAPPRPNPGLRAGAESAPGGEYETLPQPPLFSLRIPPPPKEKPRSQLRVPSLQPPAGPRGARARGTRGAARCLQPRTVLSLSCECSDPCRGSRGTPTSVPTPREI